MTPRPLPLAIASGLVAIIGAGLATVGVFLLAIAAGAVPFLDSAHPVVALLGVGAVAAAGASFVAAVALWQRRAWAWVASFAIAAAGILGALVALSTSGAQAPTVLGLALTAATVALLVAPSAREAAGIA